MNSWTYDQSTGNMMRSETHIWNGYSGHGVGMNNPAYEAVHAVGPIPRGQYIFGKPEDHPKLGPYAFPLNPKPKTNTFGRDGFYLHGDDADHNASLGCIVKSPKSSRMLFSEGDELTVV